MVVSQGANGNVFGYNASSVRKCESDNWTPCDISVHGHYPFRNLFEGNLVEEIDVTDYWGPAGPGNVFLRNVVSQEGIEVMDGSHGQAVLGNLLLSGGPLRVESGITGVVLADNTILPAPKANSDCDVTAVPDSLYLAAKPSFFATVSWPLLADGQTANPASLRAAGSGGPAAPSQPNPGVIYAINLLLQ
jgi:hypothetical protein